MSQGVHAIVQCPHFPEAGFISEHDYNIGCRIAETMCGGSMVDEQWLLNLGRKHFMELLATDKIRARVEY